MCWAAMRYVHVYDTYTFVILFNREPDEIPNCVHPVSPTCPDKDHDYINLPTLGMLESPPPLLANSAKRNSVLTSDNGR